MEQIFNELDKVKNSNQEVKLYLSVLANMIIASNPKTIDNINNDDDKALARILIDYQDRDELKMCKNMELITGIKVENWPDASSEDTIKSFKFKERWNKHTKGEAKRKKRINTPKHKVGINLAQGLNIELHKKQTQFLRPPPQHINPIIEEEVPSDESPKRDPDRPKPKSSRSIHIEPQIQVKQQFSLTNKVQQNSLLNFTQISQGENDNEQEFLLKSNEESSSENEDDDQDQTENTNLGVKSYQYSKNKDEFSSSSNDFPVENKLQMSFKTTAMEET